MGVDSHKVCRCGSYRSDYILRTGMRHCRQCGALLSIDGVFQRDSPCFGMTDAQVEQYFEKGIDPRINDVAIQEKIERVLDMFDASFIHREEELILHKKWNIYFLLPDIASGADFDYKLLSCLSYYTASNHFKKSSAQCQWAMNRISRWFRRDFTYEEMQIIYCKLGCGANRSLGVCFIESGLDMKLLCEAIAGKEEVKP